MTRRPRCPFPEDDCATERAMLDAECHRLVACVKELEDALQQIKRLAATNYAGFAEIWTAANDALAGKEESGD